MICCVGIEAKEHSSIREILATRCALNCVYDDADEGMNDEVKMNNKN